MLQAVGPICRKPDISEPPSPVENSTNVCHPSIQIVQSRMNPLLATQQTAQYKRHRPENTLLYQLVERHYPEFKEALLQQGKQLPKFVERDFDDFLRCGRLEHGFLP